MTVNLRQIEWRVQNGPITKNGVLPVTTLFFWKFGSSLRTSYKELIWCTNDPNANIVAFCKRWKFTWRYFFPVSILKRQSCHHMETSQLICSANQLTDFYMMATLKLNELRSLFSPTPFTSWFKAGEKWFVGWLSGAYLEPCQTFHDETLCENN